MSQRVVGHILQQQFRIHVIVIRIADLDNHARYFRKQNADHAGLVVSIHDVPDRYVRSRLRGAHLPKGGQHPAV